MCQCSVLLGLIIECGPYYLLIAKMILGCGDSSFREYMLVLHDSSPTGSWDDQKTSRGGLLFWKARSGSVVGHGDKECRRAFSEGQSGQYGQGWTS